MKTLKETMRSYHCGQINFDQLAEWHWHDQREKLIFEHALFNVLGGSPVEMLKHFKWAEEALLESGVIHKIEEEDDE